MLKTPQERMELLKAGVDGKTIEKLYLRYNGIKVSYSAEYFFRIKKSAGAVTLPH